MFSAKYEQIGEMRTVMVRTKKELQELKEGQKEQTEKLQQLVDQAASIGKAVVCGERRQDAWAGDLVALSK